MKNVLSFLLLLLSITTFMACKGEDGAAGANGINGLPGQDGNANVQSYTTTLTPSNWVSLGSDYSEAVVNVPILTSDIVNNGMVMAYLSNDGVSWVALPFTVSFASYTETFTYLFEVGVITILDISNDNLPVEPTGTLRVITATSDGLVRYPDLDWTDLEAVKKTFLLPD